MSDQWLYRIHGQEFGPVSLELVRSLVESGAIAPDDDVRNADRSNWILACAATELRDSIKASTDRSVERRRGRDEWFCRGAGGDYGPLKMVDLIQLAVDGELGPDEEIKSHADDHWQQVGSIRRLVELLPFAEQKPITATQLTRSKSAADFLEVSDRLKPFGVQTLCFSSYQQRTLEESEDRGELPYALDREDSLNAVGIPGGVTMPVSSDANAQVQADVIRFPGIRTAGQFSSSSPSRMADTSSLDFIVNALGGFGLPSSFDDFGVIYDPEFPSIDQTVSDVLWSGWASGIEFSSIEFSELLSWAVTGRLLPTDFVRRGDEGQYVPAVNIPALFTVRAAANSLCPRTVPVTIHTPLSPLLESPLAESAGLTECRVDSEEKLILPTSNADASTVVVPCPARLCGCETHRSSIGIRIAFGVALLVVVWVAGW